MTSQASIPPAACDPVVVCFRWRAPLSRRSVDTAAVSVAVESLTARATALGARIVGWQGSSVAFAFEQDALEDVVDLVWSIESESGLPDCSAGVACGELSAVLDSGPKVSLSTGPALNRAQALARVGRPGEVLLDPLLPAVRDQELLTRGSRLGVLGRQRVRGLRLDLKQPLRPELDGHPATLLVPPRAGPDRLAGVQVQPGQVLWVVGARGAGGSRWLSELCLRSSEDTAVLMLRPVVGEPLGALRRALTRAQEAGGELAAQHQKSLQSVLAGEGLEPDPSAELIEAWFGGCPGLVLVDDAEFCDADSIEAVARACERGGVAVAARIEDGSERPAALAALATSGLVPLAPLNPREAAELAGNCLEGLPEAARWGKRGSRTPLGIVSALAEALESGVLLREEGYVRPRVRLAGRGRAEPCSTWIERRLALLDADSRRVLGALAVLGVETTSDELATLFARFTGGPFPEQACSKLEARGWLKQVKQGVWLIHQSVCQVVLGSMAEPHRARLHRHAAKVSAVSQRPLGAVTQGVQSLLGGDLDGALPLLRKGASSARAAGLIATADALERFTESGDPLHIAERGLFAGALTDRAGLQRSDVPPPAEEALRLARTRIQRSQPLIGFADAEPVTATRFVQALREGDHAAVAELSSELKAGGAEPHVAMRLEGMAILARGEVGAALGVLRRVKDDSSSLSLQDKSRAALALALALSAAGRPGEALLEALESLAAARRAKDGQGEHACARFLARLSATNGSEEAAARWRSVAESTQAS